MDKWVVVRPGTWLFEADFIYVKMVDENRVIHTVNSVEKAKKFGNESMARDLAWKLNTEIYKEDVWTTMKIKVEED